MADAYSQAAAGTLLILTAAGALQPDSLFALMACGYIVALFAKIPV